MTGNSGISGSPRSKAKRAESILSVRSGSSSIRSGGSTSCFRVADGGQNSKQTASLVPKPVTALLKLQYSGGAGYASGFCRTNSVSISVDILPSVIITKWDVLPAETPSHCYLVLDVLNATSQEMDLQYSSGKHIAIEAGDSCRIPVPVERCPLAKLTHVYSGSDLSPEQQMEEIAKICSEHLASLVELKWTISGGNAVGTPVGDCGSGEGQPSKVTKGKASLGGLRVLPPMLDLLHMSPIQLGLELNREIWSAERGEFSCSVGDVLEVAVNLVNALETSLGPLTLQLSVYQVCFIIVFYKRRYFRFYSCVCGFYRRHYAVGSSKWYIIQTAGYSAFIYRLRFCHHSKGTAHSFLNSWSIVL